MKGSSYPNHIGQVVVAIFKIEDGTLTLVASQDNTANAAGNFSQRPERPAFSLRLKEGSASKEEYRTTQIQMNRNIMKTLRLSLVVLGLLTLMSCRQSAEQKTVEGKHKIESTATDRKQRIERAVAAQDSFNKERGQTSNSGWFCPDNISMFPPVEIKSWNKLPVVNGRLPTFEETQNGTSLIYYDINKTPDAKAYDTTLPKLASFFCPATKKEETVIVIQIVQTKKDTVVGYRFLTGGNGTHDFRDFHFLTDSEIKKLAGNSL